jgi:hypothetical protein
MEPKNLVGSSTRVARDHVSQVDGSKHRQKDEASSDP